MGFSITQFGQMAGVKASTIRYYEDENLLPKPERRNGRRVYYRSDVPRLKLLVAARQSGFKIREIKQIINQDDYRGPSLKDVVLEAARNRVKSIEHQIQTLEKQRRILTEAQSCICFDLSACSTLS